MAKTTSKVTSKVIKAVHRKAKFVGILYLLAMIVVVAFSCLTLLTAKDGSFESGVLGFYKPFVAAFKSKEGFSFSVAMLSALLYILALVIILIILFKSFSYLKILFKKGKLAGGVYRSGYNVYAEPETRSINDNREAMEDIGRSFSAVFTISLVFHFFIYLLCGAADVALLGYVAFGVGLFFHFICGVVGAKVSIFQRETSDMRYFYHYRFGKEQRNVAQRSGVSVSEASRLFERKRELSVSLFFWRNLFQIIFIGILMYALGKYSVISEKFAELLTFDFSNLDVMALLPMVLQLLLFAWLTVMTAHALNITEYNRQGMDGSGMKNYRIFAVFFFVTAVGLLVLNIVQGQTGTIVNEIIALIVVLAGFIFDNIIRPKERDEHGRETIFADGARMLGDDEEF